MAGMSSVARREPPLERIGVSTSMLDDSELAVLCEFAEMLAERTGGSIGAFFHRMGEQMRSVASWREGTLWQMESDLRAR
jgi:hypothetical protein